MCGIAGSVGTTVPPPARLAAAARLLRHRGPDAEGTWNGTIGAARIAFAHRRLAIIDLDARADQPFHGADAVLIHNGEIYNHVELRRTLETLGHSFTTASDTEVIVHAWRQWGADCFDRFEGMWAFALVDRVRGEIVLSRDRFGEKPLFLWFTEGCLYFASEVKALAALAGRWPAVDGDQVRRYLVDGYRALHGHGATWFRDVRALDAGSFLRIAGGAVGPGWEAPAPRRYWTLRYTPAAMAEADMVAGVRERLRRAVELRLRADVPLAFCLSGGVDSATLASFAARELGQDVHAFSILEGDERYDERRNIEATVADLGCTLHPIETTTEGFLDRLGALIASHDAPVATISYYLHAFLSEAMAAEGFRVAVSGTAADELFTGYYDHYGFWLAEMHDAPGGAARLADWRASYGAHVRNPVLRDPLAFVRDPERRDHLQPERARFDAWMVAPAPPPPAERDYADNVLRRRMMNELFDEAVPVILAEDDLNAMRVSVENRSPYLDRELVEFAYTIPNAMLIRDGYAKWPLRAAAAGVLNDRVRLDKQKRGFNAGIDSLLDRRDADVRARLVEPGPIFDIVRRDAIDRMLDADLHDNSLSKFAFAFVSAKLFLETPRRVDTLGAAA